VAGNITSDNVGPQHLINIKRLAYVARTVEEAFPDQGKASAASASGGSIDRQQIVNAVDRYLQKRGVAVTPSAPAASPVTSAIIPLPTESVVDRFLANRRTGTAPAPSASAGCGCGGATSCATKTEPPPPPAPKPQPPPISIADFVCENDVREAMRQKQKIYIGPKTIVTPSARDLGAQFDTIVVAQRPEDRN
jgi:hypothetical protein